MSVSFSGTFTRSAGVISAIAKQLRFFTLKPVKRAEFKFDPFHESVSSIRLFQYHIANTRIRETNPSCVFKTDIVCDRSEPTVTFKLANGKSLIFETSLLTELELLQQYNKIIQPFIPPPEEVVVVQTKASKASAVRRKR